MKYLFLALALTGCSTADYKQLSTQVGENGLQSYEDKAAVCYIYRDSDTSALSCIKK